MIDALLSNLENGTSSRCMERAPLQALAVGVHPIIAFRVTGLISCRWVFGAQLADALIHPYVL